MKKNISDILDVDQNLIGIKATTNERLGPEGREEGISCHSVVLLEKKWVLILNWKENFINFA